MKFISTVILLASISFVSFAQESKKEAKNRQKAEQYKIMLQLIQSGKFEFIGRRATTQKGNQIDLSSRANFLRIDDGNASASMPYFGVARNAAYGSSGGIEFDGKPENYRVEENDKKFKAIIKFRIKEKAEVYDCTLTITTVENVSFSVISSVRSSISYQGRVGPLEQKED
jgi:hypothetical protein